MAGRVEGAVRRDPRGDGRGGGGSGRNGGLDFFSATLEAARAFGPVQLAGAATVSPNYVGRSGTALLLDGNIGIGGEPATLLERARELLAPGGAVLSELDPPGARTGMTHVRLEAPGVVSEWFPWAHVSVDTVAEAGAMGRHLCQSSFAPPPDAAPRRVRRRYGSVPRSRRDRRYCHAFA